ncbi:MAG TPA: hypothetical protein VGN26_23950 [Armatimonadota bacterium]
MTWEEARQRTLDQWRRVGALATARDIKGFAHAVNTCTPLCEKAQDEAEREGLGEDSRCYFCLRLSPRSECRRIFSDLIVTALDGDWTAVQQQVDVVVKDLEAMRVPEEPAAAQ